MAATLAALIGSGVLSGIGQGISSGITERNRQNEFNKMFDFKKEESVWNRGFQQKMLDQSGMLGMRGQNLSFGANMLSAGMSTGSSLIGNLLSYNHAQDTLNFQKQLNSQRREDLTNEGLPLSYLHLGGLGRSVPNIPMMSQQTFGRSSSNPWGYANSGQNLRTTFGPPPSYRESVNAPNAGLPGFDPSNGFPK